MCPLCGPTLDANCEECGLWWTGFARETLVPRGIVRPSNPERITLRSEVSVRYVTTLFAFGGFGLGATSLGVWSVAQTPPSSVLAWVFVVLGLSLGALLGGFCITALAQMMLHALIPSCFLANGSAVRVKVWRTWHGLGLGFRRTDVLVPRAQICGARFMVGQGGETQLFLVHASGQSFGTGWSGSRTNAVRLGEEVLVWIEPGGSQVGTPVLDM